MYLFRYPDGFRAVPGLTDDLKPARLFKNLFQSFTYYLVVVNDHYPDSGIR